MSKKTIKVCVDCGKGPISRQEWVIRCRSCSNKKRFKDPRNHPMYGKEHSKASRKKMRANNKGCGNPMYGKRQTKSTREKIGDSHRGAKSYMWKGGKPKCPWCGKQIGYNSKGCQSCIAKERFKDPKNNVMYGKTHTLTVRKAQSERMKGEKNWNWKNGARQVPYPFEFSKKLREEIKRRDGYKCLGCGMAEAEHKQLYRRGLIVHHIDYNKNNCEKSNLASACLQCNSRFNFNRKKWIKFFKKIAQTNGWL